jgi:hypothetical protein
MIHSSDITLLSEALSKAQKQFPAIPKDKTVTKRGVSKSGKPFDYSYNYAAFETIVDIVRPILAEFGLSFIQEIIKHDNYGYCSTRILHASGQWIQTDFPLVFKEDDMQQYGGVSTYGKRYALNNALGLATDEDMDANELGNEEFDVKSRQTNAKTYPIKQVAKVASVQHAPSNEGISTTAAEIHMPPAKFTPPSYAISDKQANRLFAIARSKKWSNELVETYVQQTYSKAVSTLNRKEYDEAVNFFDANFYTPELAKEIKGWEPGQGTALDALDKAIKNKPYVDHTAPPNYAPMPDMNEELPF